MKKTTPYFYFLFLLISFAQVAISEAETSTVNYSQMSQNELITAFKKALREKNENTALAIVNLLNLRNCNEQESGELLSRVIVSGHINVIKKFLQLPGVNVNQSISRYLSPDSPLETALEIAIICSENLDVINELIQAGAHAIINKSSAFVCAAEIGALSIIKILMQNGIDVNTKYNYKTALSVACKAGHANIVDELIQAGAKIDDDLYDTPLMIAAKHGHLNIVQILIQADAKLEDDHHIDTPLMIAARHGHLNIVQLLLKAGAHLNYNNPKFLESSALMNAVANNHIDIVKEFLSLPEIDIYYAGKYPVILKNLFFHSGMYGKYTAIKL